VRTLLKDKVTRELDGFRSASGKPYTAILELDGGTLIRKNISESEQDQGEGYEVNPEPLGPCPVNCGEGCAVVETSNEFVCREKLEARQQGEKNAAGFSFPRSICKREIKREEVQHYLEHGETPLLTSFISKRGRKFSAKLVLEKDSGGFRFEFPPRAPKKKAGEADEAQDASNDISDIDKSEVISEPS